MKSLLMLVGVIALATGLLWLGQGLGYIHWPASSFMINQTVWSYYGGGLAVFGVVLIAISRR